MHPFPYRWLSALARTTLALVAVIVAAGLVVPAPPIAAQTAPACGEVFSLGDSTQSCLRIVHAAVGGGSVDVYAGETPIVQGLEYAQATDFAAVPSGAQQLRVVEAGQSLDEAAFDMSDDLGAGEAYQLTISGLVREGLAPWLSGVDVTPLSEGKARIRVVHASPDTDPVDVSVADGDTPFADIPLGSQSGFVEFDAGAYTFQMRETGTDTLLVSTPEVQIEPGLNYDIYAIGESEAGTLEMVVLAAEVGLAGPDGMGLSVPAEVATPVIAVGGTPVVVTPGAETPEPTPMS